MRDERTYVVCIITLATWEVLRTLFLVVHANDWLLRNDQNSAKRPLSIKLSRLSSTSEIDSCKTSKRPLLKQISYSTTFILVVGHSRNLSLILALHHASYVTNSSIFNSVMSLPIFELTDVSYVFNSSFFSDSYNGRSLRQASGENCRNLLKPLENHPLRLSC